MKFVDLDSPASGAGQAFQVRYDGEGERIRLKERECVYTLSVGLLLCLM